MSELTTKQPAGTPTWIDLGIPDLDRAMTFYGALFGWEFDVGPAEFGHYTQCLLRGRPVAAIRPNPDPDATDFWWNVYFATDDCDAAAARARDAGGSIITGPMDVLDQGRTAIIKDTTGAQCGLWQAGAHIGCEIVNEPNALLRNDLVTAESGPARDFYVAVFGYTLDANPDMPELDFTFLRRPDGHEIGGIAGDPKATKSRWGTLFQVDDADAAARRAVDAGGTSAEPYDMIYGRVANTTDPFGTEFDVCAGDDELNRRSAGRVVELGKTRVDVVGVDLLDKVRPRSARHHSQGGRACTAHRHRLLQSHGRSPPWSRIVAVPDTAL